MAGMVFDDRVRSPDITSDPETYELENRAIARNGRLDDALRDVADWTQATLLDIGCGTGFWLPRYARDAARVIGVEPDPVLVEAASKRTASRYVEARPSICRSMQRASTSPTPASPTSSGAVRRPGSPRSRVSCGRMGSSWPSTTTGAGASSQSSSGTRRPGEPRSTPPRPRRGGGPEARRGSTCSGRGSAPLHRSSSASCGSSSSTTW